MSITIANERDEITGYISASVIKLRLLAFFALAFLISWLVWLPLVAVSQKWISASVPFMLYYLGVIGPAAAAFILARVEGKQSLSLLLQKFFVWSVDFRWYLAALLLPGAVRFAALGLLYVSGRISLDFSLRPLTELLAIFLLMLVLVPFEETGWRGYALPRLLTIFGVFWASIILGVLWAAWHLPLMWIAGSYQESGSPFTYMLIFAITILPVSILFTWLYEHTRGSLLIASMFHAAINVTESALIIPERNGRTLLLTACALNSVLAAMLAFKFSRRPPHPT